MLENELWYGGSVAEAMKNPFDASSVYEYDMELGLNQTMPLFVSTKGRYIWCDEPMKVRISGGEFDLCAPCEIVLCQAGDCFCIASI